MVAIALATSLYLGVPLPRFSSGPAAGGPRVSATPSDDLTYFFLNPNLGWALDSRRDINGNGDFWIFRTDDGAKTWNTQLRGKTSTGETSQLTFFDPLHGFAVIAGPFQLFRTDDGGSHWNPMRIPGRAIQSIQFTDPLHGWLLDAEGGAQRNTIYFTSDGGDRWDQPGYAPDDASYLAARSETEAWMGSTQGERAHVYVSFDGGETWQLRDLPVATRTNGLCLAGITLLPVDGLIAAGDCEVGTTGGMFSSFDQGATWSAIPNPPPNSSSWARLTFAAEFDWWTMTGGDLWKSTDAGQTWTLNSRQSDGWDYIPHAMDRMRAWATLAHLDANTGLWAVPPLRTGLALTSDGGLHWRQVNVPRP